MSVLDSTDVLDVAGYAAAVRRGLVDLGPELVEDLTDDLEADLAEALADERHVAHGRGLLEQFGPPEAYAAELRAAAGLAPAVAQSARVRLLSDPVEDTRRLGRWLLGRLRGTAWWAPVESFLVALRPAWWLIRGWVAYQLVAGLFGTGYSLWLPQNGAAFLVLVGCVVLSVQWGRGAWFQSRRVGWLAGAANVVAVVAVLPLLGWMQGETAHRDAVYAGWSGGWNGGATETIYQETPMDGVVVDGMQVSNLFVYDAEGNPLSDVQVYDDRGRPVRTTYDDGAAEYYFPEGTEPWSFVSRVDADGRSRWNVYPLQGAPTSAFTYDDDGRWVTASGTSPTTPPWPFAKAPALDAPADAAIGAEGSTTTAPTPLPTATP